LLLEVDPLCVGSGLSGQEFAQEPLTDSSRPILLKNSRITCGEFFSKTAKVGKSVFNFKRVQLCKLQ
jgi:hypothetical protein